MAQAPNSASESPQVKHHATLYFPDGDIALSSKSKDGTTTVFRIDRKFLSRHSPVFADMFSLPAEPGINETYEGVAVVHMPDEAEDLQDMLGAIYNCASIPLRKRDPDVPLKVTGVMKLATKYEVEAIRTMIVRHFEAEWPRTVIEWDAMATEWERTKAYYKLLPTEKNTQLYLAHKFPEPASAIRFAVEFGIPSILAAAFYQLAITDPRSQWTPTQMEDPDVRVSRRARWDLLNSIDLMRLLKGKQELEEEMSYTSEFLTGFWANEDLCEGDFDDCLNAVAAICKELKEKTTMDERCAYGGLDVLAMTGDLMHSSHLPKLCKSCREVWMVSYLGCRRQIIWKSLSEYFM